MRSRLETLVSEMLDRRMDLEEAVAEFEKEFLLSVLRRAKGNKTEAARASGISRSTFQTHIEQCGLLGNKTSGRRRSYQRRFGLSVSADLRRSGKASKLLDDLATEFDSLMARMQTAKARKGMASAFSASPAKLGRAAVAAACKRQQKLSDSRS